MEDKPKRWGLVLVVLAIALIVAGLFYFFLGGKKKFISPVPAEPSFKVIYYTPTPAAVTPSATPSATPKVKPTVTKAPVPTATSAPASPSATPAP